MYLPSTNSTDQNVSCVANGGYLVKKWTQFMKSVGSLCPWQDAVTGWYLKPYESNRLPKTVLRWILKFLYLLLLVWCFLCLSGFRTKSLLNFSYIPYVLHVQNIFSFNMCLNVFVHGYGMVPNEMVWCLMKWMNQRARYFLRCFFNSCVRIKITFQPA